ncbi:MAG: FtsX-like permease family protein [Myxococcota bacterium]
MPFEVKVALRYLGARRKAGLSLTSFLTVAGVALGVAALTVVTSVWNGFESEFLAKLLGVNGHANVLRRFDVFRQHQETAAALREQPGIREVSPFVYSEVIVQSPRGVQGVAIKGIDPELSHQLPLAGYVEREGASPQDAFRKLVPTSTAHPGMIIGSELQDILHVEPGDLVTIVSPYGGQDGQARTKQFEVSGVFHSGMFQFDSRMVFIGLEPAQDFFRLYKTVTGLEIWTEDPLKSGDIVQEAIRSLSPDDPLGYEVKDWSVTNRGMFGAVNQQKTLISLVLFIIVVVAAFNIMATLILLILEKGREIAVLKSLGASNRSILTIFVLDGQLVGLAGCLTGLAIGLVLCALLGRYGLRLDPRVYYLERLPVVIRPLEIFAVVGGAMLLSTLATIFPAWTAARMNPVDGLNQRAGKKAPATRSPPSAE